MIQHGRTLIAGALVFGAVLVPSAARAAWTPEGLRLNEPGTYAWMMTQMSDGAGGIIAAWLDLSDPDATVVLAQRIDATGKPRWDSGRIISQAPGGKLEPRLVSDGAGGAIVLWSDKRNTASQRNDIYAQRVNASGFTQWAADGVPVHTTGTGVSFGATQDDSGGAIVVWSDDRNGNLDLFARRLDVTGAARWAATGVPICLASGNQGEPALVPDGGGGAFIAWWDRRNGTSLPYLLVAQRVNASGAVQWTANGRIVPDSTASGSYGRDLPPLMVPSANRSVLFAWIATNRTTDQASMYGQRLDLNGNRRWIFGGEVLHTPTQENPYSLSVAPDGRGGAFIGYYAPGGIVGDVVKAQRVDSLGSRSWGFGGVTVCRYAGTPVIVADGAGGAVLAWSDPRYASVDPRLFAQRVDSTGAPQWSENGVGVRVGPGSNGLPGIVAEQPGGAIVAWHYSSPTLENSIHVRRVTAPGMGRIAIEGTPGGAIDLLLDAPTVLDTVWIASGESARFRFRPTAGYYIDDVTVNGATAGTAPNQTLGFDLTPRTLHVDFANGTWFEPLLPTPSGAYTSVAFPLTFTVDSVRSVLGNLGPPDDTKWRLARWDPVADEYQFAGDQLQRLRAGEGYWLITAGGLAVQAQGKPLSGDSAGVDLPFTGWQQIANPYRFPIADTALSVLYQGSMLLFTDPSSNTVTDRTIWEWTGSSYDSVRTLQPRRAYWIHKKPPASAARLVFPNRSSTRPVPVPLETPEGAEWTFSARARQGDRASSRVAFGAWKRGRAEPLQIQGPPDPPGGALVLRLVDAAGARRLVEFRDDGQWQWGLELVGADAPGEVALEWSMAGWPAGLHLWLLDPARGFLQEIRPGATVTLAATQSPRRLTLRAAFGEEGARDAQVTAIAAAYPNPFRDRVGLTLQLSRPDVARVVVFDLQGRTVRDLGARSLEAGEHVLVWDGVGAGGRPAAPGVYLARIEIGGARETKRLLKLH